MSEEVKEIIDKLNEDKDYDDYVDYKGSYFKPLLDYITNLQEENKELKIGTEKLTQLWLDSQENKRKAIEYINKTMRVDNEYPDYMEMEIYEYKELLNILGGDDNE